MGIYDNFTDAKSWIAEGRSKVDRPVANNTRLIDRGDRVGLRLHDTDVVTLHENGDVEFDTGGWFTMTTRDRMSYHPDFSIYSVKGKWHIYHRPSEAAAERRLRRKYGLPVTAEDHGREFVKWKEEWDDPYTDQNGLVNLGYLRPRAGGYGFWQEVADAIGLKDAYRIYRAFNAELNARHIPFFDGIRFTKRGRCINRPNPKGEAKQLREEEALRKQIHEFGAKAVEALDCGPIPVQNLGDCFYCQMRTDDTHKPLGDATENHDHLRQHIEEGYVPSALLVNAMEEQPYAPAGRGLWLGVHEKDGELVMGGTVVGYGGTVRRKHSAEIVAKAVYEYVARRLLSGREVRGVYRDMPMGVGAIQSHITG